MQIRVRLASVSLFACLGMLAGCGDDIPAQPTGTGGSTGGSGGSGGSTGGSSGGTGGSIGGSGGRGGSGGTGGSIGGSGGRGGSGGTGGTIGGSGGGGTGGRGGGGGGGTGGGGTGGGGTGGGGTGGGGTGGGGTGGGAQPCYPVTFTAPTNGATLTVADDTTATCGDGFQYTVRITTSAPAGTQVQLFNNGNTLLGTTAVANGAASFDVQLASQGQSALSIQFPSTAACTDPSTRSTVTVNCPGTAPTCNISQPTITATHPALNGVLAPAGDRASQAGSGYQVTFVVTTNAEDGQEVKLAYNNTAPPATVTTLTGTASGGSATFGVPLTPDGTYQVIATCKNAANVTGTSTLTTYPVDTAAPNLTVTQPPVGHFFPPTELDTQGRFKVCGQTTSTDAAGLPASLGPAVNNLCVAVGGSSTCVGTVPVTAINTNACVDVTCPGGAPFDITVTLKDAAGNPTATTIAGVSCASTLPSVQVIAPVSDAPAFTDQTKHILAANAPVGVRDQSAAIPGAQTDVVACTDRSGNATLLVGLSGGTLAPLGSAVATTAAAPTDNCPSGLGFVVRFPGVTLPDSIENTNGSLATPTELRVRVADAANPSSIGTSVPVDLWVDPTAPVLSLRTPLNLCGSFQQSSTAVLQDITFNAENDSVIVRVTNGGVNQFYMLPAFAGGVATFTAVKFDPGQNDVTATETDPAGNMTTLAPVPCTVLIGSAPVVTFTSPTAGQILCPAGSSTPGCLPDGDAAMGWQGTLTVHVTANSTPVTSGSVTFSVGATTLGTANLDASGNASLPNVTLPDGSVTVVATTSSIPNAGVGSGSVTVTVDLGVPSAPADLRVEIAARRATTMRLTWTAPGDGGASVSGYQIRYAKVPIDASNFDNTSVTTAVTYTGQPVSPGQTDSINVNGLYVENNYHFAVLATDAAGNRSSILSTMAVPTCSCMANCCAAHLNVTTLAGVGGGTEQFGFQFDPGDVDKNASTSAPAFSDLIVGSFNGKRAYLYLGVTGTVSTAPSVTFTGDASTTASFGRGVGFIGDVDRDGFEDLAISDRGSPAHIYIYKGRTNWPATMSNANADYVITVDATMYSGSILGSSIARLGDFNGDGADDFALGANLFGGTAQTGRVVVILGRTGFGNIMLPDAASSIVIDGDPAVATSQFGYRVLGLGHFYNTTGGTTLIVSAPGNTASTSGNEGRLYAFHGQSGTSGAIPIASADHVVVGPAGNNRIGAALSNLGPILGPLPSIGSGNPVERVLTPNGNAYVFSGTTVTGPFASKVVVYQAGTALSGMSLLGGGVSGLDQSYSLIGDSTPDLVMVARDSTTFVIVDGDRLSGATSPLDANAAAAVTIPVPAGWTASGEAEARLIPDFNGDTYPDFAIGNAIGNVPGSVVVYW